MNKKAEIHWEKSPDVIERIIDGEAVLLDLKSGVYYSLNAVGTSIWDKLSEAVSAMEIETALMEEYDVPQEVIKSDVRDIIKDLSDEGLIREVQPESAG
ncbi:MAG TPA: PqqD family protein [bacterium]|nr:PqqD family protein [bacterium]